MKRLVVCLLIGLGAVAYFSNSSGFADPPRDGQLIKEEMISRQKERRHALRKAANLATAACRNGTFDFSNLVRINFSLLSAELDLAADHDERMAVHERHVAALKENELMAIALEQAERVNQVQVLEAKAARLHAEIELLRESAK